MKLLPDYPAGMHGNGNHDEMTEHEALPDADMENQSIKNARVKVY